VESGNKLVVEVRLKGSGMHWAEQHVNPMLALCNIICIRRWKKKNGPGLNRACANMLPNKG
jgi:hypothetical protein